MMIVGLKGVGISPTHVRDEGLTCCLSLFACQRLELVQGQSDEPMAGLMRCHLQVYLFASVLPVRVKGRVGIRFAGVGEKQRSRIREILEPSCLGIALASLCIHIVAQRLGRRARPPDFLDANLMTPFIRCERTFTQTTTAPISQG